MNAPEIDFFKGQNIEIVNVIGEGGFGSVFYVYSHTYKTYFALKKIPQDKFKQAEIDCLMTIDDPYIVRLYKYYKFEDNYYLLMEYCPNDLDRLLHDRSKMSNPILIQKIVRDVIMAVRACHNIKIAHCDIKPANFLIDNYGRIKICDFGMSTFCTQDKATSSVFRGTFYFMAPEVFDHNQYNPIRTDIWSLGVTLYYIATGVLPFNGLNKLALKDSVTKGIYNEDLVRDSLLKDLIARCLEGDLNFRCTIDDLVEHPYFSKTFSDRGDRLLLKKGDVIVKPKAVASLKISKHRSSPLFSGFNVSRVHLLQVDSP
ncbi:CAMK family protein kinase [Trichomonas vaginalis G3]|uniref:CAMK family protein kinase n=1 Tax=Trichomonas vaginalis (strain ATCC PRA-98 / G3) TaxID=412133 RepID=A2FZA7_TRIV3|nr:protein serine/threonine kinase protein [Trichomonas vaginalis G3]EAX89756.1 CAMK family protein kinase [Trichomonas vaginalis G3]KAI5511779.1 protein serine/threonine kinase protein [Trichomonas vaginalis G3]|eukprot:XP_001302686.1 CAMK family protein kinase [Trichomonas vaginalis G3]